MGGLLYNGLKSVVTTVYEPTALYGRRIFQPFFTTKPIGEGIRLRLSLSYDIVTQCYSGEMDVNTEERKYAEFIIRLPNA